MTQKIPYRMFGALIATGIVAVLMVTETVGTDLGIVVILGILGAAGLYDRAKRPEQQE